MKIVSVILTFFLFLFSIPAIGVEIRIDSPVGGFTKKNVQKISGEISGFEGDRGTLIINGVPQGLVLNNGRFSVNTVVAPGNNLIEVQAGDASESVSFFAEVPQRDIKVVLTWDTPTDVDLWVIDPKGAKCYYQQKSTENGGNLDVDIVTGYGPETFTMVNALPGQYSVQVQYYSSRGAPASQVTLYVILYEGTAKEQRIDFSFPMTKEHQVYHITNFNIDP